ncbi:MAG: potassium-transporting ATPase subunit KdpA [Chitinispirillaceae bacterium]|jgi:K+-transporting ATPase ATPase A chain
MHTMDFVQVIVYIAALTVLAPLLGNYMADVLSQKRCFLSPLLRPVENATYRLSGVDPEKEMTWKQYCAALLIFSGLGMAMVFCLQMAQKILPFNPQHLPAVSWHLSLNTAISFMTNTNWQAYAGETTLSYLTQFLGLTVQNFVSAASGIAVFAALCRGIARRSSQTIGNFWADLVRSTVYILLPLSLVFAVILVGQGVVQTLSPYATATTLEGQQQIIPLGPAASQIAIKQLGTNGGGFFNANSAHPFENPTPLSNFLEMLAILLVAAALTYTFGTMVGSKKQGRILFISMLILFIGGLAVSLYAEHADNRLLGVAGSLEGKETRFGITNSVIWSTATTAASNGSVNAMHESLSPLAALVAMFNLMVGEVIFGGVGSGMYGMIAYVILAVFIAGLMVGRTPEYLGKKIESFEIKMSVIAVLASSIVVLFFAALACITPAGLAGLSVSGTHGLGEVLYAFASTANNNGSGFAGLNANTPFYNLMTGAAMLIGRFSVIIPMLAIAGHLAQKKFTPPSAGTFPTDGALFVLLLLGTIVIIGALNFFPVLSLGPIIEHLFFIAGKGF